MAQQLVVPRIPRVDAAAEIILARTHLTYVTRDEVQHGTRFVYLTTARPTDSDVRLWSLLEAVTSPWHDVSLFTLADHLDAPSKQAVADAIVTLFGLRSAAPA